MTSPIRVVGAVLRAENKILACRKASGTSLAGYWEFPGGKIEPGESPEEALAREIREELSVIASIGAEITTTNHAYDFANIELTTFWCTIASGTPRLTDHDEARWVTASEAASLTWAPADIPTLEKVTAAL